MKKNLQSFIHFSATCTLARLLSPAPGMDVSESAMQAQDVQYIPGRSNRIAPSASAGALHRKVIMRTRGQNRGS